MTKSEINNILQWNINGLENNYEFLQELLYNKQINIACIQETNLKDKNTIQMKNYTSYYRNRSECINASGGVGIIIKNTIHSQRILINTNIEAIAVKVTIGNQNIHICNIYLSNQYRLDITELESLINQIPTPFIILGDFNSHNTLWNSYKTDKRGKQIETFINNNNIVILNDNAPTHLNVSNGNLSAIDLTLCSHSIASHLEWQALNELYGSDHFPLIISINTQSTFQELNHNRWKYHKANWTTYQNIISKNIDELYNQLDNVSNIDKIDINQITNKFTEILLNAANKAIPKTKGKTQKYHTPWWNSECEEVIKNYKKALNKFKKNNTEENKIEFKRLKAIAKRTVKNSKSKSWIEYINTINNQTTTKEVWRKIKSIEGKNKNTHITAIQDQGKTILNPREIANTLAETFAKNSSDENLDHDFREYKVKKEEELDNTPVTNNNIQLNAPITIEELMTALFSSKNSSPGPDGIANCLLKNLPTKGINCLLKLFNLIWNNNLFPKMWNQAIIVPIMKPNKDKYNKENYRPIALTSCLCKTIEKIVNKRLRWYLDANKILTKFQSGFRQSCSTNDCLVTLETKICDALNRNNHVLATCLDLEKAYELIWKKRALSILNKHGIDGNAYYFVQNFLSERLIQVRVNNTLSDLVKLENGVPQGSVISVTIFLLCINDIHKAITPPVHFTMFADDVTIYLEGKNIESSSKIMQNTLNNLEKFANTNGFKFSPTKTQTILFENRKTKNRDEKIKLYISNRKIELVDNVKILGLIFDSQLTWKTHVKQLKDQCLNRINILKVLSAKSWGTNQKIITNTYKALIQTKIDYGSVAYGSANKSTLDTLNPVLNTAMRIASHAYRTSPSTSLLVETKTHPLSIRRMINTLNYAAKALSNPENQAHLVLTTSTNPTPEKKKKPKKSFRIRVKNYTKTLKLPSLNTITHQKLQFCPWESNLKEIFIKNEKQDITENSLRKEFPEHQHIYTSYYEEQNTKGTAIILPNDETILHKPPKWLTRETSQDIPIIKAIEFIKNFENKKFILHIEDTNFTKKATNPTNATTKLILNELYKVKNRIKISTTTIDSNKKKKLLEASKLASNLNYPLDCHIINNLDIKKYIQRKANNKWNKEWKQSKKTHLHTIKDNIFESNPALKLNRTNQVLITRLRIGHTHLTHQHLISKQPRNLCQDCKVPQTVNHILLDCPKFAEQRREKKLLSSNIKELLNNTKNCQNVINFIDSVNTRKLI